MAYFAKVAAALLLFGSVGAHAFYMSPLPPVGFQGRPGDFRYAPSPTSDMRFGRVVFQPAAIRAPVSGVSAMLPVAYRFAANAPRVAASVIFLNPYVRVGLGIATWLGVAGFVWDAVNQQWTRPNPEAVQSDGKEYRAHTYGPYWPTKAEACNEAARVQSVGGYTWTNVSTPPDYNADICRFQRRFQSDPTFDTLSSGITSKTSTCPSGWYFTPAGCVQTPPPQTVTQQEFEDELSPLPMPDTVPFELPYPSPLPVEQPVINPEPGPDPVQRPRFVPTGDPVPNPEYDPNSAPSPENRPFIQPGVRLNPSPTATEPWRIDVQPVNRPVETSDPTAPVDEGPGQGDPGDKPKEETPGLCDLYPDILACTKLDTPDSDDLPESEKPQPTITPDAGWGADNAMCPAPRLLMVQGQQIAIPYDIFCQYMSGLRPIIIAMAWLSAGFILIGARGGD